MPEIQEHGTNRYNSSIRNTNSKVATDTAEYKLRRLKRDNPELADKVINGDLSAYEAAIQAGIATRKVALNMDNPESAARTIYKYMSEENIADLIDRLLEMLRHE